MRCPVKVSHAVSMGLVRTKSLYLSADHGCHLVVDCNAQLAWENFAVCCSNTLKGEVILDLHGSLGFFQGLKNFLITCRAFSGPACVELTHALVSLGRQAHAGRMKAPDAWWWLSTLEDMHAQNHLRSLLYCSCQACMVCLRRAKLVWQLSYPF